MEEFETIVSHRGFSEELAGNELLSDHSKVPFNKNIENYIFMLKDLERIDDSSSLKKLYKQEIKDFSIEKLPLKVPSSLKYLNNYTKTLQSWKGIVTTINEDSFQAELHDLTSGGTNEVAEIEIEDVSSDDLPLMKVGAAFYWNIVYSRRNGQIEKKSLIRFQRIIKWSSEDYDEALDRAERLFNNFNEKN